MEHQITTNGEGVITIHADGEFIGIIYNDMKTRTKRLFWVEEMAIDEIAELLERKISTRSVSSTIDIKAKAE